jgi:hypothetical protein
MEPITTTEVLVVAANEADLDKFRARHDDPRFTLMVNQPTKSLAKIGNELIALSKADVVGLIHADCVLGPGAIDQFTMAASAGALCGIVGRDLQGRYRWSGRHPDELVPGGWAPGSPGLVSTLDCCSVFMPRNLTIRFDEATFNGFHCHVEDLCLQARQRGIMVIVPAAQAEHPVHPDLAHDGYASWILQYQFYRQKLSNKWRSVRFMTT